MINFLRKNALVCNLISKKHNLKKYRRKQIMTLVKFKNNNERSLAYRPFFSPLFDDFWGGSLVNDSFANKIPAVNISENANEYRIELAAPGLHKEDFKLDLEKDTLTISVEKQSENEEKTPNYSRREFSYAAFKRSFVLPETADQDGITASYTNGVLHIGIAKKAEAKVIAKTIQIS